MKIWSIGYMGLNTKKSTPTNLPLMVCTASIEAEDEATAKEKLLDIMAEQMPEEGWSHRVGAVEIVDPWHLPTDIPKEGRVLATIDLYGEEYHNVVNFRDGEFEIDYPFGNLVRWMYIP